jgi:hypothetical protein
MGIEGDYQKICKELKGLEGKQRFEWFKENIEIINNLYQQNDKFNLETLSTHLEDSFVGIKLDGPDLIIGTKHCEKTLHEICDINPTEKSQGFMFIGGNYARVKQKHTLEIYIK